MAQVVLAFDTSLLVQTGLTLAGSLALAAGELAVDDSGVDHNSLLNTHDLTTDIDHASITGTHNLTTDIDHNALTNFVANKHIDHTGVSITAGKGLSGGGDLTATRDLAIDFTDFSDIATVGAAVDTLALYSDADARMEKITFANFNASLNHDTLTNFVANEHIDHSGVTITAGGGISGGGDLTANRTFTLDFSDLATTETVIVAADILAFDDASEGSMAKITKANFEASLALVSSQVDEGEPTFTTLTMNGDIDANSHKLTNLTAGTDPGDAVNLTQLQAASAGLLVKPPSQVSTTDDLETITSQTITYSDGVTPSTPGVGATLNPTTNAAFPDIDGYSPVLGDQILIKDGAGFVAQVSLITAIADVGGALDGKYFLISSANDAIDYYVWINVDAGGNNPLVANRTGIAVGVTTGDAASVVAGAVVTAVDGVADFGATAIGADITITNADDGRSTEIADFNTGFTSISTDTTGKGNEVNGLYEVTDAGSAGTPWELTRTAEFDGDPDSPTHEIREGCLTLVIHGTTLGTTQWVVAGGVENVDADQVGIKAITWNQFGLSLSYTAGDGLTESPAYQFNVGAGTGIAVNANDVAVDVGTTAGKILQLNGSAQIPAVSGALLTNLNASNLASGLVPMARGGTNADLSAIAVGSLVKMNAGGTALESLGQGTAGQFLKSAGAAASPAFAALAVADIGDLTATASEINQVADGVSANATAANLNALTAGLSTGTSGTDLHGHEALSSQGVWNSAINLTANLMVSFASGGVTVAVASTVALADSLMGVCIESSTSGQPAFVQSGEGAHLVGTLRATHSAITAGTTIMYLYQVAGADSGKIVPDADVVVTPGSVLKRVGVAAASVSLNTGGTIPIVYSPGATIVL